MRLRRLLRPVCRVRGHRWSYAADVCDRCAMTGTEFYATRPELPRDERAEKAYVRDLDSAFERGRREGFEEGAESVWAHLDRAFAPKERA